SVGSPFLNESRNEVGSVDGEEISITEFSQKVEQNLAQFKQQYGNAGGPQMQAMAVDNAWNGEVADIILGKEYKKLGLQVSDEELFDLVQGKNPSPLIMQSFMNQQTGQLDRAAIINSLKARDKDPNLANQWAMLYGEIERQTLQQKYSKLVMNSVFVTTLEANDDHTNRNKLANFTYVNLDYSSIADNSVKLTDADYTAYYNANKNRYFNPAELRSVEFVAFNSLPSKEDSVAVKTNIEKLAADFRTSTNDSLFAAINSDVKVPFAYIGKGVLNGAIDSVIFDYPAGSYYGPVLSGNSYKLAKVVGVQFQPDSVKASHILIDPSKVGGLPAAQKLADSLRKVIVGGGNIATLAPIYSVDGSKDKGGDLGFFGRNQMVAPFEEASFSGKTGDVKVVNSQFGVHVVKITAQKGSTKRVKVAYIEKSLGSSSKTQSAAYKLATNFFNEATSEDFAAVAKKKGYTIVKAEKMNATQGYAPGLDNPRNLIRDAFAAESGEKLGQVYQMDNGYVVARVTEIRPKGILPLEVIKKEIEPLVRNAVKAKMLTEKLNAAAAGAQNINQVAQKVGRPAVPVQNIVLANPVIPALAQENKVVGTVFGLQVNKLSKAIEGERGVYVVVVNGFAAAPPLANTFKQKQTMLEGVAQRSLNGTFQALQDKADIKDNRVKFY
ncbi:MAG: peptidylprolyl isomerase, partial [Pedobacter sp.]